MGKRKLIVTPEIVLEERLSACEDIAGLLVISHMKDGSYEIDTSGVSTETICVMSHMVSRATNAALDADSAKGAH